MNGKSDWITRNDHSDHLLSSLSGRGRSAYSVGYGILRPKVNILSDLESMAKTAKHLNGKVYLSNDEAKLNKEELAIIYQITEQIGVEVVFQPDSK